MGSENNLSLGEFLRQEREKKGMTIEQVASATKINVRLLHALEEDQYKELPAKPFIRGFVTSYSRFVGLDPREVMTQFTTYIDTRAHDRPSREGGHSGYAFEKREGDQNSRTVLGAIMGALALLGAVAILMKPSFLKHKNSHIDQLKSTHQKSAQAQASPSLTTLEAKVLVGPMPASSPLISSSNTPIPTPSPSTPLVEQNLPEKPKDPLNSGVTLKPEEIKHKVKFKANESVWVRYQVDNRPLTQFVLKQGKTLILRAEKLIKFQVSNPAAITFSYNNATLLPGDKNSIVAKHKNDASLIFPPTGESSTIEPFPSEKPLSSLPTPRSVTEATKP